MNRSVGICIIVAASLATSGCGGWFYLGQQPSVAYERAHDHMPENIRSRIQTVTVIAAAEKPALSVGGDYGQYTPSMGEGAAEGAVAGAKMTGAMLAKDPRSIILVPFIFPVALIAGSITGAAAAKIEQELQEFRESMVDDLVGDGERQLPTSKLANDLSTYIEFVADVDSVPEGGDADASLSVAIVSITVNTVDKDAIISTDARATLRSNVDESVLYSRYVTYSDRDSLRNWTADDNALWHAYVAQANRYIAAQVVADMFETVELRHVLRPTKTETFTGGWDSRITSTTPTLSWELFLLGGDKYDGQIDEAAATFDLHIYEGSRLVYEARGIQGTDHQVADSLPTCKPLTWSVRPVYRFDNKTRAGEWMSYRSNFIQLRHNDALQEYPDAPEFWAKFPKLKTRCKS